MEMLKDKSFPDKWYAKMFSTITSSVFLNGTAGKEFKCKRGVRQGEPLSPLLFAIAADLLRSVINPEYALGNLHSSFPQHQDVPFPVVQYADDTILVMQADVEQPLFLKELMHKITLSSGLTINFHKSCLVPINITQEHAASLAIAFGCIVGSFPFTYLGLPPGLKKPLVKDYAPLICRIERRPSTSSQFLSYADRLQLVNSVISSLPTYYVCTLKFPVVVIEIIDKHRKNCLWRRKSLKTKGTILQPGIWLESPKTKGSASHQFDCAE
jgi:hypothetical protein